MANGAMQIREYRPQGVLMPGSMPLRSAEEAFCKLSETLPGRLKSMPDGEVDERKWSKEWHAVSFVPQLVKDEICGVPLKEGMEFGPESVRPLRCVDIALESYQTFATLKAEGTIPAHIMFQVNLTIPICVIIPVCKPDAIEDSEFFYERRLLDAVRQMALRIPEQVLVIQWDVHIDLLMKTIEREESEDGETPEVLWEHLQNNLLWRMDRLSCEKVPKGVKYAFHFCFKDTFAEANIEPEDVTHFVELANDLVQSPWVEDHPIEWFYFPVPKDRIGRGYYKPLRKLDIKDSYLFLGLIHPRDEIGTEARIRGARHSYKHHFGIAPHCGLGLGSETDFESILAIARTLADPFPVEGEE